MNLGTVNVPGTYTKTDIGDKAVSGGFLIELNAK